MSKNSNIQMAPSAITEEKGVWILHNPRFGPEGTHFHTYGQLTPYFKGLTEGRLLGTRCTNPQCPIDNGADNLWIPPRMDCPDCHMPMTWQEAPTLAGYVYAYTKVERGGTGLEIPCPYFQVDVKLDGVATIIKSWLSGGTDSPIKIGTKVHAAFQTGAQATHTNLDLYWVRA